MSEEKTINTGDRVYHTPTGEDWIVAYVENGLLAPRGWPSCLAELSDCILKTKASPQARYELLKELSEIKVRDHRAIYARSALANEVAP